MPRYSRDYAIIYGFEQRPLTSDETFRRASSDAKYAEGTFRIICIFTMCIQILGKSFSFIPKVQKHVVYWSSHLGPYIVTVVIAYGPTPL